MAKWGEGDPRWIVEERPDATNVNNWHWSEKNASSWSKNKIKDLLLELKLDVPDLGKVSFSNVVCEGEATANNRKGKLIFFYEWVVNFDWIGEVTDDEDKKSEGTVEIPNLSEENECSEVDVNISIKSGGTTAEKFKEYLRKEGTKKIQKKLEEYLISLTKEYSADLILPTKGSNINSNSVKSSTIVTKNKTIVTNNCVNVASTNIKNLDIGTKIDTCVINLDHVFKCRAQELYNAFVIREMMCAFTRNTVVLDAAVGGKFELFGGSVTGEFLELIPNEKLVKKWRFKTWPSGHYSTVTLNFIEKDNCTELKLTQMGVPTNDFERTKLGWQNYYWESIKRTFGFGAVLI